jgi:lipopolysaccharide transport system permease protein
MAGGCIQKYSLRSGAPVNEPPEFLAPFASVWTIEMQTVCRNLSMQISVLRHRSLLWDFVRRDLATKFRGSALGSVWMIVTPILTLLVYFFVFSVVFKARWAGEGLNSKASALILFSGLITYTFFSECFLRAPMLMRENPNFIKKVVFPLEVLPLAITLSAVVNAAIGYGLLLLFNLVFVGLPPLSAIALPVVLLPMFFAVLGVTYLLASLGVYLPDIKLLVPPISMAIMYLSPVFYPLDMVPKILRFAVAMNPFTPVLENVRHAFFFGEWPDPVGMIIQLAISIAFLCVCYWFFMKSKKGFPDVL